MEFGPVNKERDLYRKIEQLERLLNSLMDDNKHTYQTSIAQVVAKTKDKYLLHLVREDKNIEGTLSDSMNYWSLYGVPTVGEFVRIQHKKDLFDVTIVERIDPIDYDEALKKKNAIMTAKGKL